MYLWTEAFHTAVIVINNQPTPLLYHRSSYEILHGAPPTSLFISSGLWMFMLCPHLELKSIRHKFELKADCCIFLGYSDDHKGLSLCRRRVFIYFHVTFNEATFYDPPSTVPRSQGLLEEVFRPGQGKCKTRLSSTPS